MNKRELYLWFLLYEDTLVHCTCNPAGLVLVTSALNNQVDLAGGRCSVKKFTFYMTAASLVRSLKQVFSPIAYIRVHKHTVVHRLQQRRKPVASLRPVSATGRLNFQDAQM